MLKIFDDMMGRKLISWLLFSAVTICGCGDEEKTQTSLLGGRSLAGGPDLWTDSQRTPEGAAPNGAQPTDIPLVRHFSLTPNHVTTGQATLAQWKVDNCSYVTINDSKGVNIFGGALRCEGTAQITATTTQKYFLNAFSPNGNIFSALGILTVIPRPTIMPVIVAFRADKYQINEGETTNLHWQVNTCGKVFVSGPSINNGSAEMNCNNLIVVAPKVSTNYMLTAYSTDGTLQTSAYLSIQVTPRPPSGPFINIPPIPFPKNDPNPNPFPNYPPSYSPPVYYPPVYPPYFPPYYPPHYPNFPAYPPHYGGRHGGGYGGGFGGSLGGGGLGGGHVGGGNVYSG